MRPIAADVAWSVCPSALGTGELRKNGWSWLVWIQGTMY